MRLPVAKTLTPAETPAWPVREAQLVLDSIPAMLARTGISPTAQLYLYRPVTGGTFVWNAVGPALELEDSGLTLKRWLRLTVRTDTAGALSDLWMDRKLTVINHPPVALTAGSFTLRLATGQSAWMDDFITGDTHPLYTDTDRDALPDLYEYELGLNASVNDRNADKDGDTLTNITEYWLGTKANGTDSDGDGMPDQWEYLYGLNPVSNADRDIDLDLDGYTNFEEFNASTNPTDVAANIGSVVYVKIGFYGKQLGTFARPFATIQSALEAVPTGGRVVLLGSGGIFTGTGNINLAVARPVTIVGRENATLAGGVSTYGFYTTYPPSTGPLTVEDLTFSNLTGGSDGSAVYSDQVPVVLRRCRFYNCTCSDDGGAVFINGASLTAEDCTFMFCTSADKGGALCAEFASTQIQRCRFLTCRSTNGDGAAIAFRQASGNMENSLVYDSLIYTSGQGAIACTEGTSVAFKFCTLLSNVAKTTTGGIFNGNPSGTLSLNSCILWDNRLSSGVKSQVNGTAWSAAYSTFESQTFTGTGNNSSNPFFITGTWLPRYSATTYGALQANPASPPLTDLDGSLRSTPLERGCCEYDDADGEGMPSAWELKNQFNPNDKADASADADQDGYTNGEEYSRQSNPRSADYTDTTGSIYVDPVAGSDSTSGLFTAPVQSISKALTLLSFPSRTRISLRSGTYTGTLNRNLTFTPPATGSDVSFFIRAINGPGTVTVDLQGAGRFLQINNNGAGGGCSMKWLTVRNGLVTGQNGGAVWIKAGPSSLGVDTCRFIACKAAQGGALYHEGARCWIGDSEFSGCEATVSGGAIASAAATVTTLVASSLSYNSAVSQGGAVMALSTGGLAITGCVFFRNNAAEGGALSLSGLTGLSVPDEFENWITNCNFKENVAITSVANASSHAGALLLTNCNTDLHACRFDTNSVGANGTGSASGGALYITSGSPRLFGSTFSANEAAILGGAIRIAGGTPWIVNSALKDNQAGTQGGGISVKEVVAPNPAPAAVIAHCTLVWNRAPRGAALYYRSNTSLYNSLSWFNVHDASQASLQGTGATLTATGNNLSTAPAGNVSIKPSLAFDNIHLAGPLPPASPNLLSTASSSYVSYTSEILPGTTTAVTCDFDSETRGTSSLESGGDEWLDSDADGLPDWFENYIIKYSGNDALNSFAAITPALRLWNSQWTLADIFRYGGDPLVPDDAQADDDFDGLTTIYEKAHSGLLLNGQWLYLDPYDDDTDDDTLSDGWEIIFGSNAIRALVADNPSADPDGDGLSNYDENAYDTNPNNPDTDGDGVSDGAETNQGTDPKDPVDSAPPAAGTERVIVEFGDVSTSKSEKYTLRIASGPGGAVIYHPQYDVRKE